MKKFEERKVLQWIFDNGKISSFSENTDKLAFDITNATQVSLGEVGRYLEKIGYEGFNVIVKCREYEVYLRDNLKKSKEEN